MNCKRNNKKNNRHPKDWEQKSFYQYKIYKLLVNIQNITKTILSGKKIRTEQNIQMFFSL